MSQTGLSEVCSPLELGNLLTVYVSIAVPAPHSKKLNMVQREEKSENTSKKCWDNWA